MRLALAAGLVACPAVADTIPEPPGYRLENFGAPTPQTLAGATALLTADAIGIGPRKPPSSSTSCRSRRARRISPAGTIWRDIPHDTIPGAIWLPNVGFGALAPETETFFKAGLAQATGGDPNRPIVVFCMRDCWMSWNAAKRALSFGYTQVRWFPDGTDGWNGFWARAGAGGAGEVRSERLPFTPNFNCAHRVVIPGPRSGARNP